MRKTLATSLTRLYHFKMRLLGFNTGTFVLHIHEHGTKELMAYFMSNYMDVRRLRVLESVLNIIMDNPAAVEDFVKTYVENT